MGFGKALLVEQCECPVGYSGLSCEVIHLFVAKWKSRCVLILLQTIKWELKAPLLVETFTYFCHWSRLRLKESNAAITLRGLLSSWEVILSLLSIIRLCCNLVTRNHGRAWSYKQRTLQILNGSGLGRTIFCTTLTRLASRTFIGTPPKLHEKSSENESSIMCSLS